MSTLSFSLSHTRSLSISLSLSLVPRLPSISLISRVSKSISPLVFRLPNTFRTKYPSSLILPTIPLLSSSLFFHAPGCASSGSGPFPCLPFSCHNRWGTCALSRRTRRPAEISAQKERTTAGLPASASARGARPHTLRTSPRSIPSTCLAKSGRRRVAGARLLAGEVTHPAGRARQSRNRACAQRTCWHASKRWHARSTPHQHAHTPHITQLKHRSDPRVHGGAGTRVLAKVGWRTQTGRSSRRERGLRTRDDPLVRVKRGGGGITRECSHPPRTLQLGTAARRVVRPAGVNMLLLHPARGLL